MKKKLLISGILRTMSRYKLRTFFMGLGIVLGVAVLVVTRSIGAGAEKAMLDNVARLFNASNILVRAGGGGQNTPHESRVTTLRIADLEAVDQALDEVVDWDPYLMLAAQDVTYRGTSRRLSVFGNSERAGRIWNRGVTEGEYFDAADVDASARVALLGPKAASALFGDEDPVGRQIRIGGVLFRVKGILEPFGMDPHGMDRDDLVQVPYTTLMRRLMNVDYVMAAKLVVDDPENVEATADRVTEILRERHHIAPGETADFSLITPALVRRMVGQANRVFKVFLPAAAGVALLVAAIVIVNVMLISVRERIAEIGLRKAVGATDRQIRAQFLSEAIAVTVLSGCLGIGLAALAIQLVATHGLPAVLAPSAVALGLLVASAVGVLAGFLPARRAAGLDPAAALR